jgi:hypothetical protein
MAEHGFGEVYTSFDRSNANESDNLCGAGLAE